MIKKIKAIGNKMHVYIDNMMNHIYHIEEQLKCDQKNTEFKIESQEEKNLQNPKKNELI
jgi:hypothetical protein